MDKRIILASASKGRSEMFDDIGLPYTAIPADIDETIPWENPAEEIKGLAQKKALQCHKDNPDRTERWIAAADTLVVFDGRPIGKPKDIEDARDQMHKLAGRDHMVISGVALYDREKDKMYSDVDTTIVTFAPLSDEEIEWYLSTGEWKGAAGSYRSQHNGAFIIEKINGSFSNVIGLPLRKLYNIMRIAGYPVK